METLLPIALTVLILLADVWAIASVWRGTKSSSTKVGWTVLIVIFPAIGAAIWVIAGPRRV
ncbi:PLDc N-terminal domain-containing protein [Pseudomonas sp. KU26590]|uniref:PLDc N-terminal domain-containing protein n=1 Tax=Pseudomonas sp. KU26590 TaxID=2991051 RepID=UPI00223D50EB|nr:PLDc N-terminal domain-containing protein [Pseudomonas sp. KU26590]UZJ57725.1 PLDc N-terminal domain-containing protein [Pseudomonas sp. KU26590]